MNFKRFERTSNLFDYQTMAISEENSYLKPDGSIGASNDWNVTDFIPCDGTEFTLSYVGGNTPGFCLYDENKQYITGKSYNTGGASIKWAITITSQTVAKYIRFSYCKANPPSGDTLSSIMLNTGSTALPYQPYKDWTNISHHIRVNGEWQAAASAHERSGGQWD